MVCTTDSNTLLPYSNQTPTHYGALRVSDDNTSKREHLFRKELSIIGRNSVPLIITCLLQYSLSCFSVYSVGKQGKRQLASVSLATITYNVTVSIFNGMATCLDTFCALAYGAGNYRMVNIYFQRCTAMMLVMSIPILLFWYNSATILKSVVPEKELLNLAQLYLRYLTFGAPAYIFFETGKRFLQCQGIYTAGQYSLFLVAPLNMFLNYTLVWSEKFGLGYIGAPISVSLSYWFMSILLVFYVILIDGKKCWYGIQLRQSFNIKEWPSMMSLGLNGTGMLLSEFIAFEILSLSSSRFGTTALAAQSITSTMATLTFQIPFGVAIGSSTRIANNIGLQNLLAAKAATKVTYVLSAVLGVLCSFVMISSRSIIARAFTDDKTIIFIAKRILLILGINQLYDCTNVVLAGSLRGQGRQKIGCILNLVCYYVFAVPIALFFAFFLSLELAGLWIGLGIGIFLLLISEMWFVYSTDWEIIVKDAQKNYRKRS